MVRIPHPSSQQGPGQALASATACGCECRCHCGNLLARVVPGGVELKCRRCKRTFIVKAATLAGGM